MADPATPTSPTGPPHVRDADTETEPQPVAKPQPKPSPAKPPSKSPSKAPMAASAASGQGELAKWIQETEKEVAITQIDFDHLQQLGQIRRLDPDRVKTLVEGMRVSPPSKPESVVLWAADTLGMHPP